MCVFSECPLRALIFCPRLYLLVTLVRLRVCLEFVFVFFRGTHTNKRRTRKLTIATLIKIIHERNTYEVAWHTSNFVTNKIGRLKLKILKRAQENCDSGP